MSIFKKDSSFDSDEYLLQKHNLRLDRSSRVLPEDRETIELEIEKELKKMSAFLGEFKCEIQDGCVRIPWDIDILNDRFIWMRIASGQMEKIVFAYADHNMEAENGIVLQQALCEISETCDWLVPQKVLEFLNAEACVWVGRSGYAELVSERDHNAIHKEQDTDDLMELLKNL